MTSKEKKNAVLREIVKPALKKAGYRSSGRVYYSERNNCCLALRLESSHYNSVVTGFCFWFDIMAFEGGVTESIKKGNWLERDSIKEAILLPDCGYLHPYRQTMEYLIDGYKNYKPQDMNVEDIKIRISDDMNQFILPQLTEVNTLADWKRKKEEWNEHCHAERVRLLRYFTIAHPLTCSTRNLPGLLDLRRQLELPLETIRGNSILYHQIREASRWPEMDGWKFILSVLDAEEAALMQLVKPEQNPQKLLKIT